MNVRYVEAADIEGQDDWSDEDFGETDDEFDNEFDDEFDDGIDTGGSDSWDGDPSDGRSPSQFFQDADSRKVAVLAIILAVIILSAAVFTLRSGDDDEVEIIIIGYDWERAYADAEALVANGPRMSGTDEEMEAALYIGGEFQRANLSNVILENYVVTLYDVNSASLSIQGFSNAKGAINKNYQHTTKFMVLGYSGSTNGNEDFEIVFVGNGTDEAYAAAGNVQGKAALVKTDGTLSYTQLYRQAMNHSAGANLIYGDRTMPISKTSAVTDEVNGGALPITDVVDRADLIPHMMLSRGTGAEIKSWAENSTGTLESCELTIDFDVTIEDRTTRVVVGEIPGNGDSDEFIVMGAHHDTIYCSEGGADNTAGVAGIIEIARQLAQHNPKRTIRMLTFGGEEEGLFGSKLYVQAHQEEIEKNCVFMTNFDMTDMNITADGKFNTLPTNTNSERRQKEIQKVADEYFRQNPDVAEKYNFSIGIMENYPYSDFFHFGDNGADFAACWGQNSPGYHTPSDRLSTTNPESWQVAGGIFGSYTLWLANS